MEKSSYQKLRSKIKEIQKEITIFNFHREVFEETDQLDDEEKTLNVKIKAVEALEKIERILDEKSNDSAS